MKRLSLPPRLATRHFIRTPEPIEGRKGREQALARTVERLRLAIDGAEIGTWYREIPGDYVEWSGPTRELLALPPGEEPSFEHLYAVIHPDDRDRIKRLIREAEERRSGYAAEYRIVRPDHSIRWISAKGRVYCDADGSLLGIGGLLIDITERKRNEDAMRALTEDLEAQVASRTAQLRAASAAKSEFLAHMSHEIRTPMNAVISLIQLLNREPLTPDQAEIVRTIADAGESLLRIINDILDFSKIEAGHLQLEQRPFDLAALMKRLEKLHRESAAKKGLRLSIDIPPPLRREIVGDALRLEQVFINLLGNAVKFTARGNVALRTLVQKESATEVLLRFEVSDTGIGIGPNELANLFQPFTQANHGISKSYGGTGLGLAICKHLVELMGGRIGVVSKPDEGSTFWLEVAFPWADGNCDPVAEAAPEATREPRLPGLRVLAVDDNQMNLFVVDKLLRKEGAAVVLAADGQQALQILKTSPAAFDVVLMDVQMPVMDGLTATRAIRADPAIASVPVIALTAGVLAPEREQALAAGVNDFLPKPLDRTQMIEMLASIGGIGPRRT